MHGLLTSSSGASVSEEHTRQSLRRVAPEAQVFRSRLARRLFNPVPYMGDHFGEKIHVDQNEKLIRYRITHVLAIDGFSRKVVGFISLPVKNGIEIYNLLFRRCFFILDCGIRYVRTEDGNSICCFQYYKRSLIFAQTLANRLIGARRARKIFELKDSGVT